MYIITSKVFILLPIKYKINNNKHVICQLYNMQIQKEVESSPASCKKKGAVPKNAVV